MALAEPKRPSPDTTTASLSLNDSLNVTERFYINTNRVSRVRPSTEPFFSHADAQEQFLADSGAVVAVV